MVDRGMVTHLMEPEYHGNPVSEADPFRFVRSAGVSWTT